MADILPFPGLSVMDVELLRERYGLILTWDRERDLHFVQIKPREESIRIEI